MRVVSNKADHFKHLRLVGVITALAAGGLFLAGAATSQTVTPQSVDPVQHFIDCAGVLITAPDIHAANCLPNNIPPEMNSLASSPDDDDCIIDVVRDGVQDNILQVDDDFPADDADDDCFKYEDSSLDPS